MTDKVITLNTSDSLFYKHYLQILNGIAGLTEKETQVLSDLLEYANTTGNMVVEDLPTYEAETRIINSLKKKKLIIENEGRFELNKTIYVPKQSGSNVIFRLKFV